ncbi:hypothetical protein [Sphingomonas flavalba]|uniref:hypothetical protein n=1 Tax=Sphingomonas flavalba TaxID=2559804 RepID=UPI001EF031D6|nr:hypothetical protein [Sphingomonas flavalba]
MRLLLIAAVPLALLTACAGTATQRAEQRSADARAADLDAGGTRYGDGATKAGAARDCVPTINIRSTRVRGDRVIDFEMAGGKVLRNVLPSACPSLGFEQRFAYKTSTSQLCSVDIITVLHSSGVGRGASCGLGPFQPIDRPAN